jgi:hypothetical protein
MRRLSALLMVAAALACATQTPPPSPGAPPLSADQLNPGPFPQDYQVRIITWLRMNTENPDSLKILSIPPPQPKAAEASVPDKNLRQGEAVWESVVVTQGFRGDPAGPAYHRFYFKDGVIRSVDLK